MPRFEFEYWLIQVKNEIERQKIGLVLSDLKGMLKNFKIKKEVGSIKEIEDQMVKVAEVVTKTFEYERVRNQQLVGELLGFLDRLGKYFQEFLKREEQQKNKTI